MNRPIAITELLAGLKANSVTSGGVVTIAGSYARLYLSGEEDYLQLEAEECELLFEDPESVELFYNALNMPEKAALDLHKVEVTDEVKETLQELFELDEGN